MKIWSWRQAIELSDLEPSTKLLMYTLANYMNEHGDWCYPSMARLSKSTGLTERSVYRHMKLAEEAGFVEKRKKHSEGQLWAQNEYRALMPESLPERDDTDVRAETSVRADIKSGVTRVSQRGDTGVTEGMTPISDKLSKELSKELCSGRASAKTLPREPNGCRLEVFLERGGIDPEACPDDWGDWACAQSRWNAPRIISEWEKFRDYWISLPGSKGRKRDWQATWRNWCRNAAEFDSRKPGGRA